MKTKQTWQEKMQGVETSNGQPVALPLKRETAPAQAQHSPKWSEFDAMTTELNRLAKDVAYWQKHHDGLQRANNELTKRCNNAQRLADALKDCETTPGALAERSHEYALRRLATITETAREALAEWSKSL